MFEVGNLLLFNPFIFKNGMPPKRKFFVVLGIIEDEIVLASLPTSKDKVPTKYDGLLGCINDDEQRFNIFKFQAGVPVTDKGYRFTKDTFIYGEQLDTYPISEFLKQKITDGIEICELGRISDDVFDNLQKCLKNSAKVKRKYKRYL